MPFRRLFASALAFVTRLIRRESVWDRVTMRVPATVFGSGSRQPFAAYFEGESTVRVASIDDIVAWLRTCEYVSDREQFQQRDVWQHPRAFERRRRGDCEDFALWAWRKLFEVGIEAEFCVGRVLVDAQTGVDRQHAWVVFYENGTAFLFEPAARMPARVIQPLADVMDRYVPHFAVNHRFDTNAFMGCATDADCSTVGRSDPTLAV
jgi:transglutaminase-like putative cysteine protease